MPPDTAATPARNAARVFGSVAGQLGGRVLHLACNVVSTLIVIRYLSPDDYGDYVVVLSTVMLCGLLADGGLPKLAIREVARGSTTEAAATGSVAVLRAGLSLIAAGAAQLLLVLLGASTRMHLAAALLMLTYATETVVSLVSVLLHVRLRQDLEAGIRLLGEIVETVVLIAMVTAGASFVALFAAPLLGGGVAALIAGVLGARRFHWQLAIDRPTIGAFFREAVPLVPALLVGVIALRLDGLLLAALRTDREVGLYGSAFQPVEYAFLAMGVVVGTAFPTLAASWASDRERFERIHRSTVSVLVSLTLLLPVVALAAGTKAVTSLFGRDYRGAAPILKLLSLCLPIMGVNAWNAFVLLAGGHQRSTLRYDLAALAAAAVLHPILISAYGTTGAAIGTFSVMSLVLWRSTRAISRHMDIAPVYRAWGRPVAAGAFAAAVGVSLSRTALPWVVVALVTAALHVLGTLASGGLPIMTWARLLTIAPDAAGPTPSKPRAVVAAPSGA